VYLVEKIRKGKSLEGGSKLSVIGDKMICRCNAWDTILADGKLPTALVNGLIGYVTHVEVKEKVVNLPCKDQNITKKTLHRMLISGTYMFDKLDNSIL
jgi:hypothetical protein